jgi:hypothetical protein
MASNSDGPAAEPDDAAEGTPGRPPWFRRQARLIVVVAAVLVVSTMGGASAAALITGRQIKDGTVTGRDIRDHSLRPTDARAGVVRRGPQGPSGPAGDPGPAGGLGPRGRDGLGGLTTVVSPTTFTVPGNGSATSSIDCPGGLSALSGGAAEAAPPPVSNLVFLRSLPVVSAGRIIRWVVGLRNIGATDVDVFLWVQCAAI